MTIGEQLIFNGHILYRIWLLIEVTASSRDNSGVFELGESALVDNLFFELNECSKKSAILIFVLFNKW